MTTAQLERNLGRIREQLLLDKRLPDSKDKRELLRSDRERIAAYELALEWRR